MSLPSQAAAKPWVTERTVDPAAAARALWRQVGTGPVPQPRRVAQGWDNLLLAVGPWYLRIAVRPVADAGVFREQRLLPLLAALPLAVPTPVAFGGPESGLPGPWMAYRPLPGRELAVAMAAGDRLREPVVVAEFLRCLHDASITDSVGLEIDPLARGVPEMLIQRVHRWLGACRRLSVEVPGPRVQRLIQDYAGEVPSGPPVLVHGDLHLRHILVDNASRATGMIDWGDACLAPAAVDLGCYWSALSAPQRAEFLAAYGAVDGPSLELARLWAVFSSLALIVSSADLGDEVTLRGAQAALNLALT